MKLYARIILWAFCIVMIVMTPFVISSPCLLSETKWDLMDQMDDDESLELDFGRLLFPSAMAEDAELIVEEVVDDGMGFASNTELPLDFSVPPVPKAENYTDTTYEDDSIRVKIEEREEDGVIWHLAFVEIASPTQFRTATAGKLTSSKVASVSAIARNNNAVVAINGDNFVDKPEKTTFEYRMTQKIRSKTNKTKDMLVIDENGDFHLVLALPKKEQSAALEKINKEHTIVNAFTFGPALVIDGVEQKINTDYGYNPNGKEPRAAIGQLGKLKYVLAIAEGRGDSSGVTHQELAHFLAELGCVQAFNLDGGNSAEMVFGKQIFKGMPGGDERGLSDIIYFATSISGE